MEGAFDKGYMLSYKLEASPSLSKGEEQESQFYLSYLLPLGETERGLDFNKGEIRHTILEGNSKLPEGEVK